MSADQDHTRGHGEPERHVAASADAALEPLAFRRVLAQFVTGVTVVTSAALAAGEPETFAEIHGMTCNSFASVSSDVGYISVCLTRHTRTARLIAKAGVFAVNILANHQHHIAHRFAGRHKDFEHDRFAGIAWQRGHLAVPLLAEAKASLECQLVQALDCGDHTLFIARVVASTHHAEHAPLVFYGSRFVALDSASADGLA